MNSGASAVEIRGLALSRMRRRLAVRCESDEIEDISFTVFLVPNIYIRIAIIIHYLGRLDNEDRDHERFEHNTSQLPRWAT